jgi:hypothetical protein
MSAKTELFGRWLQGSVVIEDQGKSTGRRFFGHAGTGTNTTGYGSAPETPFASLAYAVTQCTAGRHDIIYLLPGHTETVATTITPLASTRIVGLGTGTGRAQFTPAANNLVVFTISAANVTIENVYFAASTVAATTALFGVTAPWLHLKNIHWNAGEHDRIGIRIGALGCHPLIEDCSVMVGANGPDSWITFASANVDMPVIRNNHVIASDGTNPFDDGIIDFGGLAVRNPIIYGNVFNGHETAVVSIDDAAAVLGGAFAGNTYAGLAANNDTVVSAAEVVVTGAPAALPQTDAAAIFNVNGHVLLKRIVGVVTTAIGNVANNTKLVSSPAGAGADTDICAVLDIDNDALDTIYTITGTFANAMVDVVNLPRAASVDINVLLPPGSIDVDCAGSDGGGGRVRWSAVYVPLEGGASITAA